MGNAGWSNVTNQLVQCAVRTARQVGDASPMREVFAGKIFFGSVSVLYCHFQSAASKRDSLRRLPP
jgi:hypothetical protein